MLKFQALVFDQSIQASAQPVTYYTPAAMNERLASADKLGIMAVTDTASGGGSQQVTVQIQVSGDGMFWANKNGTAEIANGTMGTTGVTSLYGADASASASMGFVRLAITLSTATTAHVKVYVAGRDPLAS